MTKLFICLAAMLLLTGCNDTSKNYYEIPKSEIVEPTATPAAAPTQAMEPPAAEKPAEEPAETATQTPASVSEPASESASAPAGVHTASPPPVSHADDEARLEQLAMDSTVGFTTAVNTGDFSHMAKYIDPTSAYYSDQQKAIADIHGRGVKESLVSCRVTDIQWKDGDTCNMTQHTVIRCSYADGTSKDVEETYTYLMQRAGSTFQYVKMYE